MKADLLIKNSALYCGGDIVHGGAIAVKGEKIVGLYSNGDFLPAAEDVIDAEGMLTLPGVIDTHVHVRDPAHTERGTFATETLAAAAGGVTTILEQAISMPPPYSPEILRRRDEIARPQSVVDYAFFGAAGAEFPDEIVRLADTDTGIVSFKTFMLRAPAGREDEFRGLASADDGELAACCEAVARTGKLLTVHAEDDDMIKRLASGFRSAGKVGFEYHAKSRPPITEITAVERVLRIAREFGTRICIAHTSTPEAMELIRKARASGQEAYCETAPHYLFLTEERIAELGPFAAGNPPVRDSARMEALWKYVNNGTVDYIGSDHGPFLLSEKERGLRDIFSAPPGPACIELTLPLMLTAVRDGKLSLRRMVDLLSGNAARIFGLCGKGGLNAGMDADIVIADTENEFIVDNRELVTNARDIASTYNGFRLTGRSIHTVVRGRTVMRNRELDVNAHGWGRNAIKN